MKGGSAQQFIDGLSMCMEQVFVYRGRTMCIQGWAEEDGRILFTLDQWEPWSDDWNIWRYRAATVDECLQAFLEAPLFDGRTFWEAEGEMELLFS